MEKANLAEAQSRIREPQQLTGPQIAYTELWVCCMLMGEMACPTDKVKRMKLAEEEVTLQATVQGHLVSKKTKWYIMAELEQ